MIHRPRTILGRSCEVCQVLIAKLHLLHIEGSFSTWCRIEYTWHAHTNDQETHQVSSSRRAAELQVATSSYVSMTEKRLQSTRTKYKGIARPSLCANFHSKLFHSLCSAPSPRSSPSLITTHHRVCFSPIFTQPPPLRSGERHRQTQSPRQTAYSRLALGPGPLPTRHRHQ